MPSAFLRSVHGYPAMPLARQPVHRRYVRPGPLVLRTASLKSRTPTPDRDRTVSRRSEPSSRAALIGEQPNPWDLLQPQDATSRHRGAKPLYRGITKPYFRTCPACPPRSQAPLCLYALRAIADRAEGTVGCLRYLLGGDRPSQTDHQTRSLSRMTGRG